MSQEVSINSEFNNSGLKILAISDKQLDLVYELTNLYGYSEENLCYILDTSDHYHIVGLFDRSKLIAFGVVELIDKVTSTLTIGKFNVSDYVTGVTAILVEAVVHPEYRGSGLQQVLLEEREKYAVTKGAIGILTTVSAIEIASKINLISCGYNVIDDKIHSGGDLRYLMWKSLNLEGRN